MKTYKAAVVGCGRMGGFIDNEVIGAPGFYPPYSHGGGFYESERTDLVACSDFREDLMDAFGEKYGVPSARQYTDFREMVARQNPDIVSVATHVERHAEVVIGLAEAGVKAIYCEKGLAASLGEANAMAEACNRSGAILNMGAQRRYHPGFRKMKEIIDSGELGPVQNLVMTYSAGLFDHGCHVVDLLTYLIGDPHAVWVQGHAPASDAIREGDVYSDDPGGDGVMLFDNGVTAYLLHTNRYEYQVNCERGRGRDVQRHAGVLHAEGGPAQLRGGPISGVRAQQPNGQPDRRPGAGARYRRAAERRHGIGEARGGNHGRNLGVAPPSRQAHRDAPARESAAYAPRRPRPLAEGRALA